MNEAPPRRLTRSSTDRVVGGVCGGLADYTGVDPVVFRVVIAVAALLGGAGLAAYVLAWLLIPEEDRESHAESLLRDRDIPRIVLVAGGIVAVIVAANLLDGHRHLFGGGFSLVILLGAGLWIFRRQEDREPRPRREPREPREARRRARHERSRLGALTVSAALVVAGVLALFRVDAAAMLAAALLVIGLGLLVGSRWGRARLLVPLGLVVAMAAGVAAVADVPFRGGWGERTWRPASVAALAGEYRLGAGHLVLDLRDLDLAGSHQAVRVRLGAGHAEVRLPRGSAVHVDAHTGAGGLIGIGDDTGGVDVTRHLDIAGANGAIDVDIRVGVGGLEVSP